ncbi:hypothetical protein SBRCBS47491_006366 [Sporothrix bragantina]|uniref:Uncharacterized protein n=1 Tax=Sporothrix bragantina TaxID=671064 RepID=A0ABP0C5C5_9PEZI
MMPNVPRDEYGIPTNIVRVKKPASNTKRGRTNKRFVVADNNINDNTTNDNISSSNSNSNMNINNIVNEGDGSNGNGGSTVDNMSPRPVIDEIETKHYTQMVFKTSYDKNWSAEDAFRELAGGWRDRVLDAAGLSLLQLRIFRLPLIETHDIVTIVYVALQAGDVEYDGNNCLGYIRYSCKATATDTQGGREFVNGVVDIVNAEATLHPWPTSPEAATADAINESGFPTSDNAKATLRYRDLHRIATQNGTSSNLPFLPDPKQDVHIRMGGMGAHGRDSSHDGTGHAAQRQGVRREDFERWIKIALFPDSVQMATGDLLLSLPGQLYQQGLQVEIAPCDDGSRLRLGYGYNLVAGGPDHVLPQSIVMQQIWSIWEGAVAQQPELIQALHRMLLDNCLLSPGYYIAA